MNDLMNISVEAPEWTHGTETTADGEYVSAFTLFRNGALFASIPAEAEGTPYAEQEAGLRAICKACNGHADLVAVITALIEADRVICENIGSKSDQAMQRIAALDAAESALKNHA